MTQYQLILRYLEEFGSIVPAKVGGSEYRGGFFGSETSKRCRELRKRGMLRSEKDGKFERFYLNEVKDSGERHPKDDPRISETKEDISLPAEHGGVYRLQQALL